MRETILSTISVLGKMNFQKFKELVDHLVAEAKLDDDSYRMYEIRRSLQALGHIEWDFSRRMIYCHKPKLVRLPFSGVPKYLLTGARTSALLKRIKNEVKVRRDSVSFTVRNQPFGNPLLPSAVYIDAVEVNAVTEIAEILGVGVSPDQPVSELIFDGAAGINDVENSMDFQERSEINWTKEIFSTDQLRFVRTWEEHPTGDRFIRYKNSFGKNQFWLWKDGYSTELAPDWGRYVFLKIKKRNVLLYDPRKYLLAVPRSVPLPMLIERAVTLRDGLLPFAKSINNRKYRVYGSIEPYFAARLQKKMDQKPIETQIELEERHYV